jgi:hypothetical protein
VPRGHHQRAAGRDQCHVLPPVSHWHLQPGRCERPAHVPRAVPAGLFRRRRGEDQRGARVRRVPRGSLLGDLREPVLYAVSHRLICGCRGHQRVHAMRAGFLRRHLRQHRRRRLQAVPGRDVFSILRASAVGVRAVPRWHVWSSPWGHFVVRVQALPFRHLHRLAGFGSPRRLRPPRFPLPPGNGARRPAICAYPGRLQAPRMPAATRFFKPPGRGLLRLPSGQLGEPCQRQRRVRPLRRPASVLPRPHLEAARGPSCPLSRLR